jgi:hypothetical protein
MKIKQNMNEKNNYKIYIYLLTNSMSGGDGSVFTIYFKKTRFNKQILYLSINAYF